MRTDLILKQGGDGKQKQREGMQRCLFIVWGVNQGSCSWPFQVNDENAKEVRVE